jgi:mRNA-degrading endonuclease RelE of RelBE toxin-antitoxin system
VAPATATLAPSRVLAIIIAKVFNVLYEEAAQEDLRDLRVHAARRIMDEVDAQLTTTPTRPTRRRKLLEGLVPHWDATRPVWQLRVGDFRVFYDVDEELQEVIVRAIRRKGAKRTKEIL